MHQGLILVQHLHNSASRRGSAHASAVFLCAVHLLAATACRQLDLIKLKLAVCCCCCPPHPGCQVDDEALVVQGCLKPGVGVQAAVLQPIQLLLLTRRRLSLLKALVQCLVHKVGPTEARPRAAIALGCIQHQHGLASSGESTAWMVSSSVRCEAGVLQLVQLITGYLAISTSGSPVVTTTASKWVGCMRCCCCCAMAVMSMKGL